jgi:hypothetical protein
MTYKKVRGLDRAYMQAAHQLKEKAEAMPDCPAKDFYMSLFNGYVQYGRWTDKQTQSVAKALGRSVDDLR